MPRNRSRAPSISRGTALPTLLASPHRAGGIKHGGLEASRSAAHRHARVAPLLTPRAAAAALCACAALPPAPRSPEPLCAAAAARSPGAECLALLLEHCRRYRGCCLCISRSRSLSPPSLSLLPPPFPVTVCGQFKSHTHLFIYFPARRAGVGERGVSCAALARRGRTGPGCETPGGPHEHLAALYIPPPPENKAISGRTVPSRKGRERLLRGAEVRSSPLPFHCLPPSTDRVGSRGGAARGSPHERARTRGTLPQNKRQDK